jgi:regulator of sigma D
MLETNYSEVTDLDERWQHVDILLESWLAERQDLIVQFCGLSGVHKLSPQNGNRNNRLNAFCQVLVDYISAGHFEIYYQLLEEAEAYRDGSIEKAEALLPRITATTQVILDFNDRYVDRKEITDPSLLAKHLSALGETLAARFDLEDRLVAKLHHSHKEQVA